MLYARLKDLGMPADQAWPLTAQIRDKLHPVAHVAAVKIHNQLATPGGTTSNLGAVSTQQEVQAGSAVAGAAAGAAYGSVVPGIGTAVGAVVGLVASMLIHTGQGAQRLAQANAIAQGLTTIPSSFVGRLIPWQGTAQQPGLLQFISALMTGGLYMNWDPSVESSPSVNGNWSTTFMNAVKAVVSAILNNPVGATVSVPIVLSTGAKGVPNKNFTFVNPGINAGPDAIAASVIMGPQGLMYWIITSIGETAAHAAANASNGAAQKVFALMVDHATADLVPSSLSATAANSPITVVPAPIAQAATTVANTAIASGTVPTLNNATGGVANVTAPATLNTDAPGASGPGQTTAISQSMPATQALTPQQDTTAALLQQMLAAQGANMVSPSATQLLADIAANGVEASPQGPSSLPTWVVPVGIAAVIGVIAIFALKR